MLSVSLFAFSPALGELDRVCGRVNVRGSVAYVPQQAWMQNATVESNIRFGKDMEEDRYSQSLYGPANDICFIYDIVTWAASGHDAASI